MAIEMINEMLAKTNQLNQVITEMKKRGRKLAECEADYRVALAQKILTLRAEGFPATIMSDVCRGDREISRLRLQRDIAKTEYEVSSEFLQTLKLQIRVLQAEIERDFKG